MSLTPDPIDTLARALIDAIATSLGEQATTDDEWNDPDIADNRQLFRTAISDTLSKHLGTALAARFTPEQLGHLKEDADTVRDSVTHWDSWALLADALAQAADG